MRGYRKDRGHKDFRFLLWVLPFFIISLFLFASYKNSAYQQAKKGNLFALYGEPGV